MTNITSTIFPCGCEIVDLGYTEIAYPCEKHKNIINEKLSDNDNSRNLVDAIFDELEDEDIDNG